MNPIYPYRLNVIRSSVRAPLLLPSSVRAPLLTSASPRPRNHKFSQNPLSEGFVFVAAGFLRKTSSRSNWAPAWGLFSAEEILQRGESSASRRACLMLRSFLSPVRCSCISEDLLGFVHASPPLGCYAPIQEVLRDSDMHRTMHERGLLEDVLWNCLCVAFTRLLLSSKMFSYKRLLF